MYFTVSRDDSLAAFRPRFAFPTGSCCSSTTAFFFRPRPAFGADAEEDEVGTAFADEEEVLAAARWAAERPLVRSCWFSALKLYFKFLINY